MRSTTAAAPATQAAFHPLSVAAVVRAFFAAHSEVSVREEGRVVARIGPNSGEFALHTEGGKLVCHFWTATANLVRRVVAGGDQATGNQLRLQCLRMGHLRATPLVLEAGGADVDCVRRSREEFLQQVIAVAEREWRGWKREPFRAIAPSAPGPIQRLLLRRQNSLLACLAINSEPVNGPTGILAEALIWADAVARARPHHVVAGVRLILPFDAVDIAGPRRRWLLPQPPIDCYRLDRSAGVLEPVAPETTGILDSELRRVVSGDNTAFDARAEAERRLAQMREQCPQTTLELGPDGAWVFRLYGLEIARQARGAAALRSHFCFGFGRESTPLVAATEPGFAAFLRMLSEQRVPGGDRRHLLYGLMPERWMEHLFRTDPGCLEPGLDPRHIYAQVPVWQRGEREVLDLLGVERSGRLVVIELKADEDAGLPLQALDYWLRVRHHLEAGDFTRLGYFPGVVLSRQPPRLLMVTPALRWHPRADAVLRWLSPQVPWERIGLSETWREGIQVLGRWSAGSAAGVL